MSKNKASKSSGPVPVRFECNAENAQAVFIAGSFNDWDAAAAPMSRGEDGIWSIAIKLAPGMYEYKFVIDAEWRCDSGLLPQPGQTTCIPNEFGTMNFATEIRTKESA